MRINNIFILIVCAIFGLGSCTYDVLIPEDLPPIDENKEYSFSIDIQPIFNANCIDCHGAADKLNLEEGNAYDNIYPDLINTASPEKSKIYTYPKADSPDHSYEKYSGADAQALLQWIKQGALNN